MSKQESSYFEADQPIDQPQNQLQASSQRDAKILQPEISADIAQKEMPIGPQASNFTTKSASEDNGQRVGPLSHALPVSGASSWRFPRRRQHELRYILMTVLAAAVLTALAFTVGMGYIGLESPAETYYLAGKAHQKIIINNDRGPITIHCQSHGPFGFEVERYSKGFGPGLLGMDVTYTQYAATTTLTAHVPPDILFSGTRGINIDVTVPALSIIQIHTGDGFIVLRGLTGNIVATSDEGSLEVKNCQGRI
jgi:hypothetical protein